MKERGTFDFNIQTQYLTFRKEGGSILFNLWKPTERGKRLVYAFHRERKNGKI